MSSEDPSQPTLPGIFLGGLRGDLPPGILAGLVAQLLSNFQNVPKENVDVTIKSKSYAYAIVDLNDDRQAKYFLTKLSDLDNVQNIFDLSQITSDLEHFRVAEKLTRANSRHRSKSRNRRAKSNKRNDFSGAAGASRPNSAGRSPAFSEYHAGCIPDMDWLRPSGKHRSRSKRRKKKKRSLQEEVEHSMPGKSDREEEEVGDQDLTSSPSEASVCGVAASSPPLKPPSSSSSEIVLPSKSMDAEDMVELGIPKEQRVRCNIWESKVDPLPKSASEADIVNQQRLSTSTAGEDTTKACATTSTAATKLLYRYNFYRIGEVIGRESRHMEFKEGASRPHLQDIVGKYVSGFLNSAEGGALYFGVNNEGEVKGIHCPRAKEDDFRLLIDGVIKKLNPPVFTDVYAIHFMPIMMNDGQLSGTLQVLMIEVKQTPNLLQLYDYNGDAYLRRDGSLQGPLKAVQVQEWIKQRQMQLSNPNSNTALNLRLEEMTLELHKEKERNSNIRQKLENLENTIGQVQKSSNKHSKLCLIM